MWIESILPIVEARLSIISMETPFLAAARIFGAGATRMLVVCDAEGRAVGVLTRTDAMRHLGNDANPLASSVAELMISKLVAAQPSDDLLTTWRMMTRRRLNHLPILAADKRPVGVLTADDALKALFEAELYEEQLLADYVGGIGYQ